MEKLLRKEISSPRLSVSYEYIKHPTGLDILLYPMEGFQSAYALFSTKYGSVDTTFKTDSDADFVTVPEGIAHFLEHKMFENEDGSDTFARYAKTGASANAYTTFDHTSYLFSCTENFKKSLEILLDFVTAPYFTPETVEKEQGIIGQEIGMFLDDADWRVMFNLLAALYEKNPVRIDIAGTVESIAQIDADLLYRCYHTFYNLNNMALVIAGNFSKEDVLEVADAVLTPAKPITIQRKVPEESSGVYKQYTEQTLAVAQPLFQIGFKHQVEDIKTELLETVANEVALEILVGRSSPLYRTLYDEGLINASFYPGVNTGRGFNVSYLSGESRNPKKVYDEIIRELTRIQTEGFKEEDFTRAKKAAYGNYVGRYGNVSSAASMLLASHFAGLEGFDIVEAAANLTRQQVEAAFVKTLDPTLSALSVINPPEKP